MTRTDVRKKIWLPHLDSGKHEPAGHDNSYLQLVLDDGHNDFSSTGNYTVNINYTGSLSDKVDKDHHERKEA